jgi:hypothetical protein
MAGNDLLGILRRHEAWLRGEDDGLEYRVGKIASPDRYCDDPRIECSPGIHFSLTEEEAREWL